MTKTPPSPRGGIAGLVLLFCVAAGVAGLVFDFSLLRGASAWIAAQPGARAVLGAGVALLMIAAAFLLRLILARREDDETDVRDHA